MEAKRPEIPSADEVPDKPTDCEESSVLATPANSAASAATPEISKLPIPAGLATSDLTTSLADLTTSLTDLSTYLADLATSLGSLKKALAETAAIGVLSPALDDEIPTWVVFTGFTLLFLLLIPIWWEWILVLRAFGPTYRPYHILPGCCQ